MAVAPEISDDLATAWRAEYVSRRGDLSAIDWSITNQLLAAGGDPNVIAATLEEVAGRKGRNAASYALRTVRKAI